MSNTGTISQIIGPVLDLQFEPGKIPDIYNAVEIPLSGQTSLRGASATKRSQRLTPGIASPSTRNDVIVAEVQQHLGEGLVRAVSMGPTDGLKRGMKAVDTGAPISVPVGEEVLGRLFNVLGEPVDNKPAPKTKKRNPIHRQAPTFEEQTTTSEIFETGIKVIDLLA